MRRIAGYFADWLKALAEFGRCRDTLVATITVCAITLVCRFHTFANYLPGRYIQKYWMPLYFFSYGLILFLVPMLTTPLLRPSERLGVRVGKARTWLIDIGIAWAILLALILIFGRRRQFTDFYPMYKPVGGLWTWQVILFWELCQLIYMLGWEFIFRGYLLFTAKKEIGAMPAVILQMLPFAFLHLGKPEMELYGSVAAGLFLGLIALRGNSFLPCALLHFAVAMTMDVFALIYKGALHLT